MLSGHSPDALIYLPTVDQNYVFHIETLKKVIVGLTLGKPVLLWGKHGTGKTSIIQQTAARLGRTVMRVQHTLNMQETDVLGQWTVRNGQTEFQLGPLAQAMINGMIYIADEYDFAMPAVTSLYQPVLEGEPLLIKDAPLHLRKIVPHKDFRFFATGNTNGTGDETGLYQGTMMQNAANYSRFGVTIEVDYMEAKIEKSIVVAKSGMPPNAVDKLIKMANEIRKSFGDGKLSMTISPRELINAAVIGTAFGGNWQLGVELAYSNRLPSTDRKVVGEFMQRIFGA